MLDNGLSPQHQEIMDLLIEAYRLWCKTEEIPRMATNDLFVSGIHKCQAAIGQMVLKRLYPHFWKG